MKSSILASRQAASISSCVTSDSGLVAPSQMLKRIVPAYKVCKVGGQLSLLNLKSRQYLRALVTQVKLAVDTPER
jgi:hypothetical protein